MLQVKLEINTLNKNLAKATRNFNRVALGTDDATKAAIQLKKAQDALNVAYAQQNDLLGKNVQAQDKSRLSDRQSRNVAGQRTGLNNPIGRFRLIVERQEVLIERVH